MEDVSLIFTPDNEPYLGRELLFHFDKMISLSLEKNHSIANYTRANQLNDIQSAFSILIPQSISIALSCRELIRQGYVFGAAVLLRPFFERVTTALYLSKFSEAVDIWKAGWIYKDRPNLARMIQRLVNETDIAERQYEARDITKIMNDLVHGNPASFVWNTTQNNEGKFGFAVGKILNRPDVCNEISHHGACGLMTLVGLMLSTFAALDPGSSPG